jgi:hypothetical protein
VGQRFRPRRILNPGGPAKLSTISSNKFQGLGGVGGSAKCANPSVREEGLFVEEIRETEFEAGSDSSSVSEPEYLLVRRISWPIL